MPNPYDGEGGGVRNVLMLNGGLFIEKGLEPLVKTSL